MAYLKKILNFLVYNIISLYYEHFSTFLNFSMTKCHHNKTIFIPFDVDKDSTQESKKKFKILKFKRSNSIYSAIKFCSHLYIVYF